MNGTATLLVIFSIIQKCTNSESFYVRRIIGNRPVNPYGRQSRTCAGGKVGWRGFGRRGSGSRGGLALLLPVIGKQFGKVVFGVITDACEEIAQVGERIDVEPLAGRDEAGQHGSGSSPVVAAQKHPVFSTYGNSTQAALGAVVVDLQIAIFTVATQRLPI